LAALAGIAFAAMLMLMQLGFRDALIASATLIHNRLNADLVLISPQYEYLIATRSFPETRLQQALAFPEVESVAPLYISLSSWRNPGTGQEHKIILIGIAPDSSPLRIPAITTHMADIRMPDAVLADANARPELGAIGRWFAEKGPFQTEVNRRRITVVGLFELGTSFGVNGTVVTSDLNFLRMLPLRRPHMIDVGLVTLRPGSDPERARAALAAALPKDVRVLTRERFAEAERAYWLRNSPVGFIFNMGTFIGLIVGAVIVYQILYSDVADHLAEYATLKAVGYRDPQLFRIVLGEALILSVLGYIPGYLVAQALFVITYRATLLPMHMTLARVAVVFLLTVAMCAGAGALSMRKLRAADPADVF
jgi:putative ABC transport system permease protein